MNQSTISWEQLFKSWIVTLPKELDQQLVKYIVDMFSIFIPMSLDFLAKKVQNYVNVCDSQLTLALMKIFKSCIDDDQDLIAECMSDKVKPEDIIRKLNMYFLFSLIWSHGCICDDKGMKAYSAFIR